MADVEIKYNNATIASLSDSGTEVLETSGKLCEDDITIDYTKPTPNLQSKTASPTTSSRTIAADSGYDGLSQVTVNAISPTKSAQTYTPTTTDQTIASGRWLTGAQTIKGDANLVASNIKKDVQIFGVTGSYKGSVSEKDVNFIDYDGTLLYSYTASEFANLSALPANPSHTGLTAQGWNWTLANAKIYVASYGKLWIGQMYITESGDTEIDVELHAPRLSPYLGIAVNGTVEVDWGDGTAKSTVTGTSLTRQIRTLHVYATDGSYTIKIHVVSGSFSLFGTNACSIFSGNFSSNKNNRVYASNIQRVRIGSSITTIGNYAFEYCYALASITIPSGVTSISSYNPFHCCYALASITIPSEVTSIGSYTFYNCYSLTSIAIPSGITSIGINAFSGCNFTSIAIPSGVTSIGTSVFSYCYALASIAIPSGITSIGSYAFEDCYALASIAIPSGVTSIGHYAFSGCNFASITIPSGITSISTSAFSGCNFASITIPSGITSINNNSFYNCYGLGLIRFEPTTPPTVSNSNAWSNLPTDCIILIPYNTSGLGSQYLDSYLSATNYPSSNTYKYIGYATFANNIDLGDYMHTTGGWELKWYASLNDAITETNRITRGNGNEIYCSIVSGAMQGDD